MVSAWLEFSRARVETRNGKISTFKVKHNVRKRMIGAEMELPGPYQTQVDHVDGLANGSRTAFRTN
jgi:hypothetical protein